MFHSIILGCLVLSLGESKMYHVFTQCKNKPTAHLSESNIHANCTAKYFNFISCLMDTKPICLFSDLEISRKSTFVLGQIALRTKAHNVYNVYVTQCILKYVAFSIVRMTYIQLL